MCIHIKAPACLFHLVYVLILMPALALGCADDQAPLLSDIENTDFFYSITDSTVKARNARYGSGKSVKVFQGQVFEMERPDGSWVFTFYTLALEVRGADKLNVMLVNQASGDVITTLQVLPEDPSVFELHTVGSNQSPVAGVSKIQISFESTADLMNLQQLAIQACAGCPLGYDSLLSLYDGDNFELTVSTEYEDPKLAFRGSGGFLNVTATTTLQLVSLPTEEETFLLMYTSINVTGASTVKFTYKALGEIAVQQYISVTDPNAWTVVEMPLPEDGSANNTKVIVSPIATNETALLSDLFVLACRESTVVTTTEAAADPPTCYLAGETQNDFLLDFENPSSSLVKPSNPDGVLKGSGIQVWVYDYILVIRLPSDEAFDLVELTVSVAFLQTATYWVYDVSNNLISTGMLEAAGGDVYGLSTPIDGVAELRIDFKKTSSFHTAFVSNLEIDACPKTETTAQPTTEAPTTEPPTTEAPTTEAPTTEAPTTEPPTTEPPTTEAPTTEAPTTEATTTEAPTTGYYTTTAAEDLCPDGSAALYAKHTDVDFDLFLDENDLGLNPFDGLEGSGNMLTVNQNNTYHVNRSIIGVPYQLMEVRFDIKGASQVLSGALDYIGYISQMIDISDTLSWTSVNLTIQDGGFVDIFEVTLEWFGDGDIYIRNLFVLACKVI